MIHYATMKNHRCSQKGQILLAVLVVAALILGLMTYSLNSAALEQDSLRHLTAAEDLFYLTDSLMRDTWLRLLREPNLANDSLTLLDASCSIEISGTTTKTILVSCERDKKYRQLRSAVDFSNGLMTVRSIEEVK